MGVWNTLFRKQKSANTSIANGVLVVEKKDLQAEADSAAVITSRKLFSAADEARRSASVMSCGERVNDTITQPIGHIDQPRPTDSGSGQVCSAMANGAKWQNDRTAGEISRVNVDNGLGGDSDAPENACREEPHAYDTMTGGRPKAAEDVISNERFLLQCLHSSVVSRCENDWDGLDATFRRSHAIDRQMSGGGGASFDVRVADIADTLDVEAGTLPYSRISLLFEDTFLHNAVLTFPTSDHPYSDYLCSFAAAVLPIISSDEHTTWTGDQMKPRWARIYLPSPLRDVINALTHPATDVHFRLDVENPEQLTVMVLPEAIDA